MNSLAEGCNFDLGALSDPTQFLKAIDLSSYSRDELLKFLKDMHRVRIAENTLADKRKMGLIGGPVHLGVGQEAIAVGVSASLTSSDRVFGAHRSHAHLLALGSELQGLYAEVLGRDTGLSKGMGGSMHLWDQPRGFYGSAPIVAGTVALAVGAGLAAKLQRLPDVSVAYLGDGAVEEGVFHESLNLARITNAPTLFVVENNLFASHMHISQRQPFNSVARFAWANGIPAEVVDGNDVVAVAEAAKRLILGARSGDGPGFLEAVTYRWFGHVDWREDIDVGVERSATHVEFWRARDPIKRLSDALVCKGLLATQEIDDMIKKLLTNSNEAWGSAARDCEPASEALLNRVYEA